MTRSAPRRRIVCAVILATATIATPAIAHESGHVATVKTPVADVYPTAGSHYVEAGAEIAFRGLPSSAVKNISVVGSRSGKHAGRIASDSDGSGASFIPAHPFTPGEKVTVTAPFGLLGGSKDSYSFTIVKPAVYTAPVLTAPPVSAPPTVESYASDPSISAPTVTVSSASQPFPGDVFTTPYIRSHSGIQIDNGSGQLIYYQAAPAGQLDWNLRPETYQGQPVLTYWQGTIYAAGFSSGEYIILDNNYKVVARVKATSGLFADAHDFELTPQGFAYFTIYNPISVDARSSHGSANENVLDSIVQEIDVATGRLVFEWHSLDHVGLGASYTPIANGEDFWDYSHINSVQAYPNDSVLISLRDTHGIYVVKHSNGAVTQEIGGRYSTVHEPAAAVTDSQHDAEPHGGGIISVFDNGSGSGSVNPHTASRGLILKVSGNNVQLVHELDAPQGQLSSAMGDVQILKTGYLVDFGLIGTYVLYDLNGNVVRQVSYQKGGLSYRAFLGGWTGTPATTPGVSITTAGNTSTTSVSWNGATGVASYRIMNGPTLTSLTPVLTSTATGFETTMATQALSGFAVVQALDASGKVMGASTPVTF